MTDSYVFKAAKEPVAMAGDPNVAALSRPGGSSIRPTPRFNLQFIRAVEDRRLNIESWNTQHGERWLELACQRLQVTGNAFSDHKR